MKDSPQKEANDLVSPEVDSDTQSTEDFADLTFEQPAADQEESKPSLNPEQPGLSQTITPPRCYP